MTFRFLPLLLVLAAAKAQEPGNETRAFPFPGGSDSLERQEMITVLRQVTGAVPAETSAPQEKLIVMSGSPNELAVCSWILDELQTGAPKPSEFHSDETLKQDGFASPDSRIVQIFFLDPQSKPLNLQEAITVLRQVTEVTHLFSYTAGRAIVLQTDKERAKLTEWLMRQLTQAPPPPSSLDRSSGSEEFRLPGAKDDVTRVFHWSSSMNSGRDLQQLITNIRHQASVHRVFPYSRTRSLPVRGTAVQLAFIQDLVAVANASGPPAQP